MGPSQDNLAEVKRDAASATLRHFRNDMEDNHYEPLVPLDEVRAQVANIGDPWSESAPAPMEAPVKETPAAPKRTRKAKAEVSEAPVEDAPEDQAPAEGGE